ncbi:hypothetical protein AB4Z21_00930 [Paenibacillus sp. MCAF20]
MLIPISAVELQNHIESERKKHELWAFLSDHGSGGGNYSHGYLAALRDIDEKIKTGKLDLVAQ